MQKMKNVVAIAMTMLMMCSLMFSSNAANGVTIKVDGKTLSTDVEPLIESGRTLVPIRFIAEALGAQVVWDTIDKQVDIISADKNITLKIGSKTAKVNDKNVTLDVPAKINNGRTLIPLRFVSENLGANVAWTESSKTVTVDYFSKMSGTIKISGSTTIQPIVQAAADKLMAMNKGLSISVAGGGSGAGIKDAASGEVNIGCASREVKSSEKAENPDLKDIKIGSDGIAIVLNKKNPVKSLTKQQVYDIFTGKINNWKDVGGDNGAIFVQTREPGSGTLGAFEEMAIQTVNKDGKIVEIATPHTSNGLMRDAVGANKNAIGFLSFGYLDSTVNAPSVQGVGATVDNALEGKWPYVRPLNVVTKGTPSGITAKFLNYLTTAEGQKILSDENYLTLKR